MNKYSFIKPGNTVYWHDPESVSDGKYQVISVPEDGDIEDDSIIFIASEGSEVEVFPTELSPV